MANLSTLGWLTGFLLFDTEHWFTDMSQVGWIGRETTNPCGMRDFDGSQGPSTWKANGL